MIIALIILIIICIAIWFFVPVVSRDWRVVQEVTSGGVDVIIKKRFQTYYGMTVGRININAADFDKRLAELHDEAHVRIDALRNKGKSKAVPSTKPPQPRRGRRIF